MKTDYVINKYNKIAEDKCITSLNERLTNLEAQVLCNTNEIENIPECISSENILAYCIATTKASIPNLCSSSIDTGNLEVTTHLTAECASIEKTTANDITANSITTTDLDVTNLSIDKLNLKKYSIDVSIEGEKYLKIPSFTGNVVFEYTSTLNTSIFKMIVNATNNNYVVNVSQDTETENIKKIYTVLNEGKTDLILRIDSTPGTLTYYSNDVTELNIEISTTPPETFETEYPKTEKIVTPGECLDFTIDNVTTETFEYTPPIWVCQEEECNYLCGAYYNINSDMSAFGDPVLTYVKCTNKADPSVYVENITPMCVNHGYLIGNPECCYTQCSILSLVSEISDESYTLHNNCHYTIEIPNQTIIIPTGETETGYNAYVNIGPYRVYAFANVDETTCEITNWSIGNARANSSGINPPTYCAENDSVIFDIDLRTWRNNDNVIVKYNNAVYIMPYCYEGESFTLSDTMQCVAKLEHVSGCLYANDEYELKYDTSLDTMTLCPRASKSAKWLSCCSAFTYSSGLIASPEIDGNNLSYDLSNTLCAAGLNITSCGLTKTINNGEELSCWKDVTTCGRVATKCEHITDDRGYYCQLTVDPNSTLNIWKHTEYDQSNDVASDFTILTNNSNQSAQFNVVTTCSLAQTKLGVENPDGKFSGLQVELSCDNKPQVCVFCNGHAVNDLISGISTLDYECLKTGDYDLCACNINACCIDAPNIYADTLTECTSVESLLGKSGSGILSSVCGTECNGAAYMFHAGGYRGDLAFVVPPIESSEDCREIEAYVSNGTGTLDYFGDIVTTCNINDCFSIPQNITFETGNICINTTCQCGNSCFCYNLFQLGFNSYSGNAYINIPCCKCCTGFFGNNNVLVNSNVYPVRQGHGQNVIINTWGRCYNTLYLTDCNTMINDALYHVNACGCTHRCLHAAILQGIGSGIQGASACPGYIPVMGYYGGVGINKMHLDNSTCQKEITLYDVEGNALEPTICAYIDDTISKKLSMFMIHA